MDEPIVIDCFPFSYECDLLEIRLNTLKGIPGIRHILIESPQTFSSGCTT